MQLSWFEDPDYRRSINHAPVVNYLPNPPGIANIRQRIGVEKNEVSYFADLDCAQILICSEYACRGPSAGMERLRRR